MATQNLKSLLTLLLSSLCISICGGTYNPSTNNRKLLHTRTRLDDSINTTPITNPANFPPYTPTPTIVTIPASNPTSLTYPTAPTTTTTIPAMNPPTQTSSAPITQGQTWCVAQPGAPESSLQSALDYACGIGGADCSTIQQGATCYNPNSLQSHASYAFNSYFQKNPVSTSCNFGGAAMIVNTNPSVGSCIFPSSATGAGTATPASTIPPATTSSTSGASGSPYGGTTGSPYEVPASGGYGSPPSLMNPSYPASGFPTSSEPDSPPTGPIFPAGAVVAASIKPCNSYIILVTSLSIATLILC